MKKDQNFSGVLPPNLHQGFAMNPLQSLQHLKTPTCILQHSKTQSCSIFVTTVPYISKTAWTNACIEYY